MTEGGGADRPHRPGRGIAFGVLFGVLTAVAWYLLVLVSGTRHPYFMSAVGFTAAYGVYLGSRTVGVRGAITAIAITVAILLFAGYFVERELVLRWFEDSGDQITIPAVPYVDWMRELFQHEFSTSILPGVFAVLALASAGFFGFFGFPSDEADQG